ncbi:MULTISPECIES: ATP-binding protein [Verrucomicrobium]|jgi:transitional endoplasmic reticulum ATPase|uniref:ATP-binding protein n=1 Tax=Verrucomicrobium TaxID=2735 RepID=UPI0001744C7C|nr:MULTISPECIES: ATP-binding protein [Verrucomicrobium]
MSRLQTLREALTQAPDNTALLLLYGHACLDELHLEEAQEILGRLLALEPDHAEAQLSLARVLVLQGDTSGAAVRAERVLQKHPQNAGAHLLLSRIHLTENQRSKALEHYKRAQEIDSSAADAALEADLGRVSKPTPQLGRERNSSPLELPDDDEIGSELPQEFFDDPFDEPAGYEWRPETFFAPGDGERFRVTFADVGGMEALKEEIRLKIIYPLQHPDLYKAYGRKSGGGILLYGPPGCGKTTILRATAGEVSCNYFAIGLHEVFDPYYGSIERNLHQIFETARANTPCVLVFDELDSLAPDRRHVRDTQMRNVVNQFLSELDGLRSDNQRILVIGATNSPWQLDPALRRPGRFDQAIFVPPPDDAARHQIIRLLAKDKPIAKLDHEQLVATTAGFSGADLRWVFDRAAELALADALHAGKTVPITMELLQQVSQAHTPTTQAWLDGVKQQTPAAQQDALYHEVRKFMQATSAAKQQG